MRKLHSTYLVLILIFSSANGFARNHLPSVHKMTDDMPLSETAVYVINGIHSLTAPADTVAAPGDFITVWDMSKSSESQSTPTSLRFGITTWQNRPVSYTWTASDGNSGSGTLTTNNSALITGLPAGEIITLSIAPEIEAITIAANSGNDKRRLVDVTQWGTATWSTMENAFSDCVNLNITATDMPDLSAVSSMRNMFRNCQSLTGPANIGSWNTANVTNMEGLFSIALAFNQDISSWNTANVTDMRGMFVAARSFNQNIGNWNTTNVTNMQGMFQDARTFNQNIGNWNTQNVTNMQGMFAYALAFNKDISNWRTSNVTNMSYMFRDAKAFNQNISSWNTNAVTDMSWMFCYSTAFNQPIGNWNTAAVTNMNGMFASATSFNQDINNWNTAAVTNMNGMFDSGTFNKPIGNWNTAAVTDMHGMFNLARSFNQDISGWDVSSVIRLGYMFTQASAFNQNLGSWQLNPNVDMTGMLDNSGMDCQNYAFTLQGWANNTNIPSGRNLGARDRQYGTNAVAARTLLTTAKGWTITGDSNRGTCIPPLPFITVWDMSKSSESQSTPTSLRFGITTWQNKPVSYTWTASGGNSGSGTLTTNNSALITGLPAGEIITLSIAPEIEAITIAANIDNDKRRLVDVTQWGTATWSTMENAFNDCVNLNITATDMPDLSAVSSMRNMFRNCQSLTGPANIGSWNTANVTHMEGMFQNARAFNQNIGNWNTQNVTNMQGMFAAAEIFNQNIGNWNTSNVFNMLGMFFGTKAFNQNIGSWNTQNVMYMGWMFTNTEVFNQDIGSWNTSNVTNMDLMFQNARAFNQNIGSWDTQNVISMNGMFTNTEVFNQDIGSWNTSNVTNMALMFQNARAFNQNIGNWNTQNVTYMSYMFRGAKAFNQDLGSWQLNPNVDMTCMLDNSGMDCQNYTFTLQGWANNTNTPSGRNFGAQDRQYGTNALAARTLLTTAKGWTITGDSASGQNCGLPQTITAVDITKTYGDAPFIPNITASSGLEVSYVSADNSIAEAFQDSTDGNKWKLKINKAGEVDITAKQIGNDTYGLAPDVIFTLTINKADLTVTANAQSKEYGTTDPALTYTATGFVNGDTETVLNGLLIREPGENIGTYAIAEGTLGAGDNYTITFTGANFEITKATLNIVADAKSKVYGTADPEFTYTVTGLANGDDPTVITGNLSRITGENIGTYAIEQGTLAVSGNYDVVYTGADFSITKATLNIVADAKSKTYGTDDPALTYTVTGLANGDNESIVTGVLTRTTGENIGTYAINQGTLAVSGNYDIAYTGADFNITKATLNIVADAKSKTYGTDDPALTYTVTGLTNGDDQTVITGALTRTAGENIGTYAINQGTLAVSGNYDITYTGADFNITKATLNIVADAKSKTYGTADPVLTYTVTGLANGDNESIVTGALTRTAGENIGTYAINQGTLAVSGNYDITYTGADFNITKATLNIVADAKSKTYGTADPVLTYTVTGLTNGDDQTVIMGTLVRTAGETAGIYPITQGTLNAGNNYDIVYTGANFTIMETLAIVDFSQTNVTCYGSSDGSATVSISGGTAPYTYLWSPNGETTPTATGLTAGTYTVTVTDANGAVTTKVFNVIQPQAVVPPTAEEVQEFCRIANPTISDLEIQGTQVKWYVSENSTQELPSNMPLAGGTTYYASQTANGCESPERTLVIVILNDRLPAPEGSPTQDFEEGATIADLVVTPTDVAWYASYDDAVSNTNPLSPTMQLVDGTTYYAVAIADGQCSSLPLAVTANAALGIRKPQKMTFKYYPNPVEDYLNIQCSETINSIEVYNLLGQRVRKHDDHSTEVRLFLGDLPDGTYALSVMSNGKKLTVKVVKK